MLDIHVKTIPHNRQRYDTCGDWHRFRDTDLIEVSQLSDWRHEYLVALHEFIEWGLCTYRGIPEQLVTQYDQKFKGNGEPGDSPDAPYHAEHAFATKIEKMIAKELDVDWKVYDKDVNSLVWKKYTPANQK